MDYTLRSEKEKILCIDTSYQEVNVKEMRRSISPRLDGWMDA